MPRSSPFVRPYAPSDRAAVGEICIATARRPCPEPELLPILFAYPYVDLEPELAFVLDQGGTAIGYVLGTADTATFAHRFRTEWLPGVAARFPDPPHPQNEADELAARLHRPERLVRPELAEWPAHLHIDLLPEAQGRGHGRELITVFLGTLAAAGVPGVHLGVAGDNTGAIAFYERLGFRHVVTDPDGGRQMARRP